HSRAVVGIFTCRLLIQLSFRNLKMEAGMYQQQMVMILRNHGSGFVLLGKFQGNRLKHLQGQLGKCDGLHLH
ncbi:Os04g0692500, partial [Oryza sativa Japonica Group]